jgi:DNA-binding LacI/PurR family transcriptional regulator
VLVDSDETDGVSCIDVDEENGMREVAEYILSQGHRRILVLAFESGTTGGPTGWHGPLSRRKRGVDQALENYGLAIDDPRVQIREIPCTRAGGAAALRDVWLHGEHPTAVITFSDIIAFGVLDAAHELGIDVPGELSVTGFDDLPESEWARPGLTTARQPIEAKGRLASEYLVDAIAAHDSQLHRRRLHTTLVIRDSVTAPRPA